MGYLIGGAGEGAEKEITASSDNPFAKLSDSDLIKLRDQTEKDVAKFNNFQMARKIALNSAYGCLLYTSPSPRDATLSRMPSSA